MTLLNYKKSLRKLLLLVSTVLITLVCATAMDDCNAYAGSYPMVIEETDIYGNPIFGAHAMLTKQYEFYCDSDGNSTIWKIKSDGDEQEMASFDSFYLHFVGKANNLYYFNATEDEFFGCKGVYSYKLGDTKFKKIAENINFWPFSKKDYNYPVGIMNGRYIPATRFQGTDASEAYHLYIYDLKTNTKKWIGHPYDIYRDGKKLYWITTSNFNYNSKTKIIVKSASLSGKNIKILKKYNAKFLKDTYGRGEIGKKYIKWRYFKIKGNSYKTYVFKKKYRQ